MRRIRQTCGSLEGALEASEEALKEILTAKQLGALLESRREIGSRESLAERFLEMNRKGIFFTCRGEPDYPSRLMEIPDSPEGIYYRGKLPEESLSVAVVGARDCSAYGARVAEELGRYLGEQGIQVVSGMARGIDGISQAAALSAGGSSFAVLGSGVDVCYPASNRALYEKLLERGGILSSYPPGTAPLSRNFPPRNRIVSGLADALVVVEARDKSGTLITVDMALEQGREVYVVPGRITDRLSDGCNRLLRQGAGVFLSPREFLSEIQPTTELKRGRQSADTGRSNTASGRQSTDTGQQTQRELPLDLEEIYLVLDDTPESLERIAARVHAGFSPVQINALLMRLCVEGLAVQVSPGHFRRQVCKEILSQQSTLTKNF